MGTVYHSFSLCLLNIDTYVSFIPLIPVWGFKKSEVRIIYYYIPQSWSRHQEKKFLEQQEKNFWKEFAI